MQEDEEMRIPNSWVVVLCAVICVTVTVGGCGGDETLDPTGNWNVTTTWGTGDCPGVTGTESDTFTVTTNGDTYVISGSDPKENVTGTMTCDVEKRSLSATAVSSETLDDGSILTGSVSYNLKLDTDDKITGSGTLSITGNNGFSCNQAFTVTGKKS
ncbi:MAG: hypothetical protein V2A73_20515 [Pseudomonadota bacterium]